MTDLKAIKNGIVMAYDKLVSILVLISCLLIVLMMLSICASVLFRRSPINFGWALEISEYILVVITLFGSGWLLRSAGHTRVDILATYMRGKNKVLYNAIVFSIVSMICLVFTIIGVSAVGEAYSTGTIEIKVYFQFKKWIFHSLFPLAGFVMWVESSKIAIKNFINYFSNNSEAEA